MLKLERASRGREITIRLKNNEPVWNRAFQRAFMIAVGIHLLFLLVFKIAVPEIPVFNQLPTMMVEAELGVLSNSLDSLADGDFEGQGFIPRYVVQPEASIPEVPSQYMSRGKYNYELRKEVSEPREKFQEVDRIGYIPDDIEFSFGKKVEPIMVVISGRLSRYKVQVDPKGYFEKEIEVGAGKKVVKHRAKARVKVDRRSGVIFSVVKLEEPVEEQLKKICEVLLREMKFNFEGGSRAGVEEGEVTVDLQVRPEDSYEYLLSEKAVAEGEIELKSGVEAKAKGNGMGVVE